MCVGTFLSNFIISLFSTVRAQRVHTEDGCGDFVYGVIRQAMKKQLPTLWLILVLEGTPGCDFSIYLTCQSIHTRDNLPKVTANPSAMPHIILTVQH